MRRSREERGSLAVEFALILPVLALVLLGSLDVFEAVNANRKLSRLCQTVADLAVEEESIGAAETALLRDATSVLAFGLDSGALDVDIASFGATPWRISLLQAQETIPHAKGDRTATGRNSSESLIEVKCAYRFRAGYVKLFPLPIDLATVSFAAPKRSERIEDKGS